MSPQTRLLDTPYNSIYQVYGWCSELLHTYHTHKPSYVGSSIIYNTALSRILHCLKNSLHFLNRTTETKKPRIPSQKRLNMYYKCVYWLIQPISSATKSFIFSILLHERSVMQIIMRLQLLVQKPSSWDSPTNRQ